MEIMGVVNVTPDSFSDGGKWASQSAAVAHGRELLEQGATILDIGGESTRPGATALTWEQEWERIGGVVKELAGHGVVSVDTYHAQTARRAVEAGARIVNDVTGGQGDPAMFATVAELGCEYILQHGRGDARSMNSLAKYDDVVEDVRAEIAATRDKAVAAGVAAEKIILDPGLGFAKLGEQDWQVLRGIDRFTSLGHRVLVGQSRKRFLAGTIRGEHTAPERDTATAVISLYLADKGVWAARVHNVQATASALATAAKLQATEAK